MEVVQDIPKFYTALAEWLACVLFIILLPQRYSKTVTAWLLVGLFVILCLVQELIGIVPIYLWMAGMALALIIMYGSIRLCCKISSADAGFYWAVAFMFAEFAASLEWQLYSFLERQGHGGLVLEILFLTGIYGVCYFLLYRMERRRLAKKQDLKVTKREVISAAVIAVGAFLISNISYANTNTPFSGKMTAEIFYIRTLVDLAGVIMLIALQDRWQEMQMKKDYDAIRSVLQLQYEQYRQSRESIEVINRKYHDLKHQISVIRMEQDSEKREKYLRQLEKDVQGHEIISNSGNPILDTILTAKQMYCQQHGIQLTVMADGKQLAVMEEMDICSIFGNALDNAIESVEKLADEDKRLIRLSVFSKNALLMIRVENYFESDLHTDGEEFRTTKQDKDNHGYGLKSIQYVAEQYGGSVDIQTEDHWFILKVLIPV